MRQIRITTANFTTPDDNDCILSPDDPIHELMATSQLGGLGSDVALLQYDRTLPTIIQDNRGKIQREQNIKPGTEEWFKLWFGRKGN